MRQHQRNTEISVKKWVGVYFVSLKSKLQLQQKQTVNVMRTKLKLPILIRVRYSIKFSRKKMTKRLNGQKKNRSRRSISLPQSIKKIPESTFKFTHKRAECFNLSKYLLKFEVE